MNQIRKETLSTYGLIFVSIVWGLGFPALKVTSESIPTFYLIGLRFLMAFVFLFLFFFKKLKEMNKALIRSAFILSIFLYLCYICATLGIKYTTSAKASFFSCLGVLVIPVILRLFFREKVHKRVTISILVCTAGLFLISYTKGMGFYLSPGDIICLGCSFTGASHVILTGRVANDQDPALLATIQLFFISVWAFLTAFLLEDFPTSVPMFHWGVMLFLALFCTAIAFLLQCSCQRYISPARTGVIFAIEPVSGAFFSAWLLGDHLGINGIVGGAMIFASMIYMELGESKRKASNVATDVSVIPISENIPSQELQELYDTNQKP
jgi:drug/metabolite transporter (DMT)-like permease